MRFDGLCLLHPPVNQLASLHHLVDDIFAPLVVNRHHQQHAGIGKAPVHADDDLLDLLPVEHGHGRRIAFDDAPLAQLVVVDNHLGRIPGRIDRALRLHPLPQHQPAVGHAANLGQVRRVVVGVVRVVGGLGVVDAGLVAIDQPALNPVCRGVRVGRQNDLTPGRCLATHTPQDFIEVIFGVPVRFLHPANVYAAILTDGPNLFLLFLVGHATVGEQAAVFVLKAILAWIMPAGAAGHNPVEEQHRRVRHALARLAHHQARGARIFETEAVYFFGGQPAFAPASRAGEQHDGRFVAPGGDLPGQWRPGRSGGGHAASVGDGASQSSGEAAMV